MPHFDIVREARPTESFRIKSVIGTYDLQQSTSTEHFVGDFDLPEQWNVGLIVGRSGSGKTTIANELFADDIIRGFDYTHDNILDDMPKTATVNDICKTLTSVGFSSPPSWLKSYHVLSNGEKMRCDIARAMLEDRDCFVFDEFTSVVDRNVAQISSFAIQKAIRRKNKKFIAVTCHYDVQDWLMPDWVFNTDDMTFHVFDVEAQKKNRPIIKLDIFEVDTSHKEYYWQIFRKYHYLNHSFNKAARVFVSTCNGDLCAFCATLPFPHPTKKNTWKGHRSVVLPDFQGVGIGTAFTNYIGDMMLSEGKQYIATTSNPAMIFSRVHDKRWITTRIGRTAQGQGKIHNKNKGERNSASSNRITVSFQYVGDKYITKQINK